MNSLRLSFSGAELTRLRKLVADVTNELALARPKDSTAPKKGEATRTPLEATWSRLVEMLDLGPEPALHECPKCKRLNMLGSTRCGYCWSILPAKPSDVAATTKPA
jgi:hypothetical protein